MPATDKKTIDLDNAWDEGELGQDESHVRPSTPAREAQVESATDLQMISVRLQKELITQLKFIADFHNVGYQPLIRDVLCKFARSEMLLIAQQMKEERDAKQIIDATIANRATTTRKRA